ncbi:capsid assembly protein [Bacterioplanoides sp.]|uniref:capsid assembly protein n=1 Tax=Bacterioplanoides sp. TaxID=2066072 RepID=UPI003B00A5EF
MSTENLEITPDNQDAAEAEANAAAEQAAETLPQFAEPATEEPGTERPEWLPEQFSTPEEMAAAYAELSQSKETEDEPEANAEAEAEVPAGLEQFTAEYEQNGALSDESYTKLSEMGIGRDIVDQYIAGIEASQLALTNSVLDGLEGGQSTFDAMSKWAANTLSEAQLQAYNLQVESGNIEVAKMAVQGLHSQYVKATGGLPAGFQTESSGNGSGIRPFSSNAEVVEAMGSARYENDPAYREEVRQRLGISNY